MGASISTAVQSRHEDLLMQLAGTALIEQQDIFWKQLFMFGAQLAALDPAAVEHVLTHHTRTLLVNNATSHNFQSLVLHTISLMNDARTGKNRRATANALCLVRTVVKQVAESGDFRPLHALFQMPPGVDIPQDLLNGAGPNQLLRIFVRRLFATVAELEASDATYALLYEAVCTLTVCASTQLYAPCTHAPPPGTHPLLELFVQQSALSSRVVQRLLQLFIRRPPAPAGAVWHAPPSSSASAATSSGVVASLLWLPMRAFYGADTAADASGAAGGAATAGGPLCEASLLLLLLLVHQPDDPTSGGVNPFKYSLYNLQDEGGEGTAAGGSGDGAPAAAPTPRLARVRFSALYAVLAGSGGLTSEPSCLLLYNLLHGCKSFQDFMLSRTDMESLVLPVLRMLYECPRTSGSHMYMLQVLLLILSQDNSFSQNVHKIVVPTVPWYKEQVLSAVPLGSLVFIVLLRTVSANSGHRADLFLPTNALAAVANLAPHVACFSSVAAQRLIGLLQVLIRRYAKVSSGLAVTATAAALAAAPLLPHASSSSSPAPSTAEEEAELLVIEEFLRILLEVVTAILLPSLQRNLELLYALLHRQEALALLRGHPRLGDHVQNLQRVVEFFNKRLDAAKAAEPNDDWSVGRVLELVTASAPFWRPDGIVAFPEQRFVYEEEPASDEFFVPYVWQLITAHMQLPWHLDSALILPAPLATAATGDKAAPMPAAAATAPAAMAPAYNGTAMR